MTSPIKSNGWRSISWMVLGIGLLIVAGGLALGWSTFSLVRDGTRVEAEIVELRLVSRLQAPILRFRMAGGETREVKDIAVASPHVAVGDRMGIFYRPADPDNFRVDTFDRLWVPTILVIGFGGVWLLFGLGVGWIGRRLQEGPAAPG